MGSVRARLLPGLACAAFVLVALHVGVGLTPPGWAFGAGFDVGAVALLGRALVRSGAAGPRPADQVTLVRAALVGGVAAMVAGSFVGPVNVAALVCLAAVAVMLDTVDGRLARRTHTESALGARFDMEVDAFLILVLSVYVARSLGAWVLLIGTARYVLLVAGHLWPWLRQPTPPRYWGKVVAATQAIVLTLVAADAFARPIGVVITVTALLLLVESFAREVVWLVRAHAGRPNPVVAPAASPVAVRLRDRRRVRAVVAGSLTMTAFVVLWLTLTLPNRVDLLTPETFVQIPAEGLVLTAAALLLPVHLRQIVAAIVGGVLGVLVLLKVLDMGFYAVVDKAFNPVNEWGSLGPAIGVLRDSLGSVLAYAAVGGAVLLALGMLALSAWAALRVTRLSATHRRGSAWIVGALSLAWVASATAGFDVAPKTPVASLSTTTFAAAEVRSVADAARDRQQFAGQIAAADPYSSTSASDLLTGLQGKDVIFAFVESYGQTAVQGTSFAPGVVSVLDEGTTELDAAGFSSRSAFLNSPTFGGLSWLAHSTFQSGLWVDSTQRYGQLMGSSRFTLSDAFNKAGWRTVADVPSNIGVWTEGTSFYHYDQLYNSTNTGYRGPRFSYAMMPDQYTLDAFRRLELTPGHAPVMAEIDLVSSHSPWTPLPRMIDWDDVGDGSIYDPMPAQGPSVPELYKNYDDVRASYGQSIEYSLESLISFVQTVHDDNLVVVLLGDHQPYHSMSGPNPNHQVPISIIAHDPNVIDRVSSWGWDPGLRPSPDAAVWQMSAFRDEFLDAFNGHR